MTSTGATTGYASSALALAAAARLRGGTTPTRSSSSEAAVVSEQQLGSATGVLSPRAPRLVAAAGGQPGRSSPATTSSSPTRATRAMDAEVEGLREANQQLMKVRACPGVGRGRGGVERQSSPFLACSALPLLLHAADQKLYEELGRMMRVV